MACCPQETSAERKGMRLVRLRAPGGLENLKLVEEDHPKPRPGELLVRIRASSLNFHSVRSLGERGLNIQTETAGATAASISAGSRRKPVDSPKADRESSGPPS